MSITALHQPVNPPKSASWSKTCVYSWETFSWICAKGILFIKPEVKFEVSSSFFLDSCLTFCVVWRPRNLDGVICLKWYHETDTVTACNRNGQFFKKGAALVLLTCTAQLQCPAASRLSPSWMTKSTVTKKPWWLVPYKQAPSYASPKLWPLTDWLTYWQE